MAWIESFEIRGLAGRSTPVRYDLDRNLNIFWGLNGAGKTTLLRILHAALNNETVGLEDMPFEAAEVVFRVGDGERRIARHFRKQDDKSSKIDDEEELFLAPDVSVGDVWVGERSSGEAGWVTSEESDGSLAALRGGKLNHSYLPITRIADGGRRMRHFDERKRNPDELFVEQVRDRWRDYSTKSLSRIRDIQQQGLATVLAILFGGSNESGSPISVDDVDPAEAYNLVRGFLSEQSIELRMIKSAFIDRFQRSTEHREVVTEIQTVQLLTDAVLAPQREFQSLIDSMYRGNKRLVLAHPRRRLPFGAAPIGIEVDQRAIPLKSLSSGEKQLLQILLEVLSANSDAVMIDEPELSLHVNWQQQLVSSMRRINSDCQLLLASHSPEIMADVPDDHIFEL